MKSYKLLPILIALSALAVFFGCKDDDELPAVSKTTLKSNGPDYAILQGRIYVTGSSPINRCGICWSIKSTAEVNPDLLEFPMLEQASVESIDHDSNEPGMIKMRIGNLQSDTVYFARFFAQNSEGIIYSYPARIETQGIPEGFSFVEAIDGFQMGSASGKIDEMPVHNVLFEKNFFIMQKEVSVEKYAEFLNGKEVEASGILGGKLLFDIVAADQPMEYIDGEWIPKTGTENKPMTYVTWHGANEYASYIGGYLPTEAEWEFAARGGVKKEEFLYAGSDDPNECGWFNSNSDNQVHDGGLKKPNGLNIFDMSGNVQEWCSDWYDAGYYGESVEKDPPGAKSGAAKVIRGGSFDKEAETVTARFSAAPDEAKENIGFRVIFK